MSLIDEAIWFIESHSAQDITLDHIADTLGVSRYHLVRAFGVATGYSVMRYLRARRLSIAAQTLANGACTTILDVAIDAGYGSHEAFTRAFREQFGFTPESIRTQGHLDNIELVEAIKLIKPLEIDIAAPRIVTRKTFLVAGLRERYGEDATNHIPSLWQRFAPYIGIMRQQKGANTYGVCYNSDDEGKIDYMAGFEVANFSDLPKEFDHIRIPEQRYAVFTHSAHISTVERTWNALWSYWLRQPEYEVADAPYFESYSETFDSITGNGGVEIWIPLKR